MGNGLGRGVAWLVGWAAVSVGISAWLLSKVEMTGEDRRDTVVGVAAVVGFCAAVLALSLRRKA